jgi:hypothetical protein
MLMLDLLTIISRQKKRHPFKKGMTFFCNYVPGEIRTPDRTLRRRMLYPAELLGQNSIELTIKYTA